MRETKPPKITPAQIIVISRKADFKCCVEFRMKAIDKPVNNPTEIFISDRNIPILKMSHADSMESKYRIDATAPAHEAITKHRSITTLSILIRHPFFAQF